MTNPQHERFLRIGDVIARTALSRSYIYVLIGRNEFPAPRNLGTRCSRWIESEVDAWISKRA
ncbi:AlpA family transcriptional regulator [Sphingobium sp. DC-2]|uniref:helix-turn-helix transcriptional regulator n=1 Tax=Sphingobium sp. DC-2 TaxID=1303256 RepID=UPI0004C3F373|nr:AlpA family phage regulatory protein [Sphingobium sp. DC-2]